jgi:hypothetical protein
MPTNEFFVAHAYTKDSVDLRNAIQSACKLTGFKPVYANEKVIDKHILDGKILPMISGCLFCLFEVSKKNRPNVFIEYGYAKAKDKPCFLLIHEGVKSPSDLDGYDRIQYSSYQDLRDQLHTLLLGLSRVFFSEETLQLEPLPEEPEGVQRVLNKVTNETYYFMQSPDGGFSLHPGYPIIGRKIDIEAARTWLTITHAWKVYKLETGKDIFDDVPKSPVTLTFTDSSFPAEISLPPLPPIPPLPEGPTRSKKKGRRRKSAKRGSLRKTKSKLRKR